MAKMKNYLPVECVQFNASMACSMTPAHWCDPNQSRQLASKLSSMRKDRQVIGVYNAAWSEIRFSCRSHSLVVSVSMFEKFQEKTRPKYVLARKLLSVLPANYIGLLPDASIINFNATTFHFLRFLPFNNVMNMQ